MATSAASGSSSIADLTTLRLAEYSRPPRSQVGRCLLAQYTDREVIVYQAYNPDIGEFAAEHNYFGGGGFSFRRMSWIKPQFTWMMHRCGWATKSNQETVLALHLRRDYWDSILSQAVISNYGVHLTLTPPEGQESQPDEGGEARWRSSLRASNVVVQWDPDHQPFTGHKTGYRVIQLGLRRDALAAFRGPAFGEGGIENITAFARETAKRHGKGGRASLDGMLLPVEEPIAVEDIHVARRLGLD